MQTYLTRRGELLDWVCAQHYGGDPDPGVVEMVLEANRNLAEYGPILPEGLLIVLPDRPAAPPPVSAQIRIWD